MLKSLNKEIKLPKLKLPNIKSGSLKLPKLKISKVKTVSGGIVTIDPYNLLAYNFANNLISKGSINIYDKKNFYISYLYLKDFISGTIEISRSISEEDLKDAIEIAAYDEFGLDSSVEYLIKYIEVLNHSGDNRLFNIFAIAYYKIDEIFEEIDSIKHLDYLTPAPLLFDALYKKDLIKKDGVDCFLHFDYDDAFLAIYSDGEFIYAKSITHSLKKLSEEFAKSIAQHVDEKEFFDMLKKQGLKTSDQILQKHLMKIFSDLFNYINDILAFSKRSYELNSINKIYISSKIGDIKGLKEFCQNYTSIESVEFDIKASKNAYEVDIDPLVHLMIIQAKYFLESSDESFNISIYKKDPPFFTTPSGILTKSIAAGFAISLIYPGYLLYQKSIYDKNYQSLYSQNQLLTRQTQVMKMALANIEKEKKAIEEKLQIKSKELEFKTKLLKEIYNKKVAYNMKVKILNDLFKKVNKHQNKVVKVANHNNIFYITVRSNKDKKITEFIKELSLNKKYIVGTNLIKKDDNRSFYQSLVKVGINENYK